MQTSTPEQHQETPVALFPEIDLKVYVRIIWHWAWLIILCVALAAVSAYITSSLSVPVYRASSTLLIDQANNSASEYVNILSSERIARTYAELMERRKLLQGVAEEVGIETPILTSALTNISVTPVRDTQLVQVSVEGISPQIVALVANYLPQVFVTELNAVQTQQYSASKTNLESQLNQLKVEIEQAKLGISELGGSRTADEEVLFSQLRDELAQYQSSYTNLLGKYEDLRLAELQATDTITIVDAAQEPFAPIRPRVLTNTLLAAIVGGVLALGIIFLVEYLDDRIRSPQDLYGVVDTPILGTIATIDNPRQRTRKKPMNREDALLTVSQPRHPIAESYRRLRTNLRFSSVKEPLKVLLVTSATASEGKTTTAANLGAAVAQAGHSVILIDADLRKPQLHTVFKFNKGPGLTDALLSDGDASFFLRDTDVPNLQVLTCGSLPPNPAELLGSRPMQQLLEQLQTQANFVIIDAPPILAVTDAQILSEFTQGVLLVVNAKATSRALVANAVSALAQVEARLLGVVLNQMTRTPRSYYYYDSYAEYYAEGENIYQKDSESAQNGSGQVHKSHGSIKVEPAQVKPTPPFVVPQGKEKTPETYEVQQAGGEKNGYYQLTSYKDKT